MATETITRLIDDLDGSEAERTVTFAWDGRTYEIDLSKKNVAALEKTMKPRTPVAGRRGCADCSALGAWGLTGCFPPRRQCP